MCMIKKWEKCDYQVAFSFFLAAPLQIHSSSSFGLAPLLALTLKLKSHWDSSQGPHAWCACSSQGEEGWEFVMAGNRRKPFPPADVCLQNTSSILVSKSSSEGRGIRGGWTKSSSTSCQTSSHFFTPVLHKQWSPWKEEGKKVTGEREKELGGAARTAHASHWEGCHVIHEVKIFLLVSKSSQVYQASKSSSKSILCVYLWASSFSKTIRSEREGDVYWKRRWKSKSGNVEGLSKNNKKIKFFSA